MIPETVKETPEGGLSIRALFGSSMPIESAPKNEYILLCLDGKDVSIGCWNKTLFGTNLKFGGWVNDDGTESTPFTLVATHWMPLPELPAKFENVSCSQCGQYFGQGEHGFSHCEDHMPSISQEEHASEQTAEPQYVTRSMAMDAGMPEIEGMIL